MDARPGVEVRLAVESDLDELSEVLGRSFDDDPVMNFVVTARPVAPRAQIILGTIARIHLADESVYVATDPATGRILGAAVWGPPGHWRIPTSAYVRHGRKLLRAVGLRGITKIGVLAAMEKRHPTEPHHYLAIIGTDPDHQGKGIGTALMAPVLDICDESGLPAYLESSKESNVPYYRRFRFDVTAPYTLEGGPSMWFMWRPAPD